MVQLNRHLTVWNRLFCLGFVLSFFESTTTLLNQKEVYNYAIDVRPVDRCPMNMSELQYAAERTGCNRTHGYHCVPDKFHSKLIEFCYNKERILIAEGNCLELAANGVLNYVSCHEFTMGCPENLYFSNEIYKYPFCLSLAFQCFTSDIKCLDQKFKEQQREVKNPNCTTMNCEENTTLESCVLFGVFFIFCWCASLFFLRRVYRKQIQNLKRGITGMEQKEEAEMKREGGSSDDLQVLGKVESDLVFDNIDFSLSLRRYCRNGAFKIFNFLLEQKIMKKENDEYDVNLLKILSSRDKDGCTMLHCAAEGGSVDIFQALMKASDKVNKIAEIKDKIKIDDTTYDGRSVLHLACKNRGRSLCRHLLINNDYKYLLLNKKTKQGWTAAHFAAVGGNMGIMDILESMGLDISIKTENGLGILDISCIHNNTEMSKDLISRKELSSQLCKSDACGWTIAHFAAMAGNIDVFEHLIKTEFDMVKTKNQKTILHICCEYGNEDLCIKILNLFGTMVFDKDYDDWNALHYAAKGGNIGVFKAIETHFKGHLCETTRDGKTALHIACINKRTEICEYICKNEAYQSIINSKSEYRDFTVAHYTAIEKRQDGTEEALIRIFQRSKINFQATTVDGLTVLGVACEQRNRSLINYLLKNHCELLGVKTDFLKSAAKESNDDYIVAKIAKAINIHNQPKVKKKLHGMLEHMQRL